MRGKKTNVKVGDKLRIIEMQGEPQYTGKVGVVEYIDDIGQLHGTWGGCAIIPDKDKFKVIRRQKTIKCCFCGKEITVKEAHNAAPLKEGCCCEQCNIKVVIPYRAYISTSEED